MYEVEYKIELTETERQSLIALFLEKHFEKKVPVLQKDVYIEAKVSPYGGYDLKRYRDEGQKVWYTEKIWEKVADQMARKEIEKEISRNEMELEVPKYPDAIHIKKERQSFNGSYQNVPIHVDMDSVKFDHSPSMRYFIEAEVITEDKEKVKEVKEFLKNFLRETLSKEEVIEAPGMFSMAFKKL